MLFLSHNLAKYLIKHWKHRENTKKIESIESFDNNIAKENK